MNKSELTRRASYLADKLNEKNRRFIEKGYGDRIRTRIENVTKSLSSKYDLFTKSGNVKKGIKTLEKMKERDLQRLVNILEGVHKSETIGTVRKYQKFVATKYKNTTDTIKARVGETAWQQMVKAFGGEQQVTEHLLRVLERERGKRGKTFNSEQVILEDVKTHVEDDEVLNATLQETNEILEMIKGKEMRGNSPWRK